MYRTVQRVRDDMSNLQEALRSGVLADSTREIGEHTNRAMALVDEMLAMIRSGLDMEGGTGNDQNTGNLMKAAERALTLAWDRGEKVALGTSPAEMRARILDFKTYADFADAYVSAALGTEL